MQKRRILDLGDLVAVRLECAKDDCQSAIVYPLTDGGRRPPRECPDCGASFGGPFGDNRERELVDLIQTIKCQGPGRGGTIRFEIND